MVGLTVSMAAVAVRMGKRWWLKWEHTVIMAPAKGGAGMPMNPYTMVWKLEVSVVSTMVGMWRDAHARFLNPHGGTTMVA